MRLTATTQGIHGEFRSKFSPSDHSIDNID